MGCEVFRTGTPIFLAFFNFFWEFFTFVSLLLFASTFASAFAFALCCCFLLLLLHLLLRLHLPFASASAFAFCFSN